MKKIFEVLIEKTIYVLADDEAEAELEAKTYETEEEGDAISCREIRGVEQIPVSFRDSLPYGGEEDLTLQQILELPLPPVPFVDPPEQQRFDFPEGAQPA